MGKNGSRVVISVFVGVCLAISAFLTYKGFVLFSILLCGLGLGYVLQRSRFCIASAFTDLLVFKDGALFRALILFILVSSIGFFLVELVTGRQGFVIALGWRTVIGGLLFGCGMVLAGGCAAGTLMRLGEGYVLFVPALVGLIIGSTTGSFHYEFWVGKHSQLCKIFIPDLVGKVAALFLQIVILIALWIIIKNWENR